MKRIITEPMLLEDARKTNVLHRIRNTPSLLVGSIMFAVLIILAVFIPFLSPYDPSAQDLSAFCSLRLPDIGWGRTNWDAICLRG